MPQRSLRYVLSLGLALWGGECAGAGPPVALADVHKGRGDSEARGETSGKATVLHTVKEGETLWDIARAYGVPTQAILEANAFQARKVRALRTGMQLAIPGASKTVPVATKVERAAQKEALPPLRDGAYHYLQRGESLWSLARLYDVKIDRLMEKNGFSEDVHGQLRIGQAIIIPGIKPSQVKSPDKAPKRAGLMHEVSRGETVWDIARTFGVSTAEIMSANGLSSEQASNIREGQKLFLPGVEDDGRGKVRKSSSARQRRAEMVARRLGLGTLKAAAALLHGRVDPKWTAAAGGGNRLSGTLQWPVSMGWFVRGFGSGQGGYHKAMDIMGQMGWNVRAAADGIVGYSGDQVPGFGNMVMVVHPGGWVTLYAHNSVNFVVAGEKVQKGSVLAEVGSTGRSQGPHVHFELIYDGKNCDPAPLFRPGVRHRSGTYSKLEYTTWRIPNQRPKLVACAKRQKHPIAHSVLHESQELESVSTDVGPTTDRPAPE